MKFRLSFDTPEVLKGESGTVYKTLDARCDACVVNGGVEPACVGEDFLEAHRELGYECPRREWADPYDSVTAELAWLGASQDTAHLFRELIAALELSPAERRLVVRRVLHAYRDEAVAARLWPKS